MARFYTGIGSRETPKKILGDMEMMAKDLSKINYILRSGGAKGADTAFELGAECGKMVIYRPQDSIPDWAYEEVAKFIPKDRPPLHRMNDWVQKLLARNMMQILGDDGNSPSNFVICWTPKGVDDGGTGYAIRCAWEHDIRVYNLKNPKAAGYISEFIMERKKYQRSVR